LIAANAVAENQRRAAADLIVGNGDAVCGLEAALD
jgi:hypothetical protein